MFCKTAIRSTKIFAAIIIVLVASCKSSQKASESVSVVLDEPLSTDKTLLWQISGKDLKQPSYLFGTIHVISAEDFHLGQNVLKKLERSGQIVLEMDLDNINTLEVAQASLLPEGKTIKDYLHEDDYVLLESYFADSLGAPLSLFKTAYARLKPFFLQQMVYLKYLGNNTSSYEMEILDKVRDRSVSISGLETLTEQLALVDEMSLEEQYAGLLKAVREGYLQAQYLDEMIDTYKSGDIQKLHELIADNDEYQDISNTLIDERNKSWVPKLEQAFQKGATFVAVGAGHLGGTQGLIELLREKGYTVQPIAMD